MKYMTRGAGIRSNGRPGETGVHVTERRLPCTPMRASSAREARRDQLLPAALEGQPQRLRLRPRARLERDVHDQPVDAELELARVDPERDQRRVLRVLDLLDDLAVEHEGHGRDLAAADARVERPRLAARRSGQLR